jgi:hypothetical protein
MAEQKGSEDAADQIGYLDLSGRIPLNPAAAHDAFELALALALGTLQGAQDDATYANDVAWQQLLVGDAKDALDMANQAISDATGADGVLPPDKIWLIINKADALMLLHQTDAARKLYLAYRNVKDDGNGNAWRTDVLGDFAKIRAVSGDVPLMDEITADFSSKLPSPKIMSRESIAPGHGGGGG